jgi:hypothetical protein
MTSKLEPLFTHANHRAGSYVARTASHSLIPAAFHPHHGYDLSSRILLHRDRAPLKIWHPRGYIYVISYGHILLFALSIFHCDDLDFWITSVARRAYYLMAQAVVAGTACCCLGSSDAPTRRHVTPFRIPQDRLQSPATRRDRTHPVRVQVQASARVQSIKSRP